MKKLYILLLSAFQFQNWILVFNMLQKRNFYFHKLIGMFLGFVFITGLNNKLFASVDLTTSTVAAGNIAQGTSNNIIYVVKMDVTTSDVAVTSLQYNLTGTYDNNDLPTVSVYFNASAPTISGATILSNLSGLFAGPHTFNASFNQNIAAGSSGYFIVTVNADAAATNGHTVKIDGAANPVVFGFTTSPTITNNQSNVAGTQTIQAANVALATSATAAGNIAQGTSNNIIYVVKMDVTTSDVAVNSLQYNLTGTYDNNDLPTVSVYFNASAPTISGATILSNLSGLFAGPHTFNASFNQNIAAGSSGYFIVTVNADAAATNGHTVKIDGAANPVVFGFTTSPTITNNQSDVAGTQTIQSPGVTLTTSVTAAGNIAQGTSNNIIYVVKMDVTGVPVAVNSLQYNLTGTYDNNDLPTVSVYFNASAPTISGATILSNLSGLFAAPHTFNASFNQNIAAGSSGYFIVTVNTDAAATNGNTVKIDGAANPVVFGFTTLPTITNNQSNVAGTQTIQAANATLTTSVTASGNIAQGTSNNIIYVVKMDVTNVPVAVNSLQYNLTGTYDNNDLPTVSVYFNASAPTISGATILSNLSGLFAAPHTFNASFNQNIASGSSGYFIVTVNLAATATNGNTVKIDGAANPVVFGFTTSPIIANNQTDLAGTQTITGVLPVTFISVKAYQKQTGAAIEWEIGTELNTNKYIVERSGDGTVFNSIGETIATGSGGKINYNFDDVSPLTGNNFYRIIAVDNDGKKEYSAVIKIYLGKSKEGFSIYPNPVIKNGQLTLELQNLKKDNYTLSMFNQQGQIIMKQTIEHTGGSSVQTMSLSNIAAGMYSIQIQSKGIKFVKSLIIQ